MSLTAADFDLVADDDADPIFGNSKITRHELAIVDCRG